MSHALATVAASAPVADSAQYLTFALGEEVYAIGILSIKEIIEFGGVTAVPMMPATIRGVINLRGAVVPVMDLAVRFGKAESVIGKRSCIVIVETEQGGEQQVIGVVVDSVSAVQEIATADIEPPPSFGLKIATSFVAGIGKVQGRFVIVLDVGQVLALDELAALQPEQPARLAPA